MVATKAHTSVVVPNSPVGLPSSFAPQGPFDALFDLDDGLDLGEDVPVQAAPFAVVGDEGLERGGGEGEVEVQWVGGDAEGEGAPVAEVGGC